MKLCERRNLRRQPFAGALRQRAAGLAWARLLVSPPSSPASMLRCKKPPPP